VHSEWQVRGRRINDGVNVWDFYHVSADTLLQTMDGH